jgi:16S rRNA (adenine1518-N6/adenine1519-N6)-dimethyltransferase
MVSLYQEARAALRESAFRPKKKLGQHFLVHETVIEAILRLLDPSPEDEIVEIGPGLGFLTRRLVEAARTVWAVEVDTLLAERLRQGALGSHPGFHLIPGDVLKVAMDSFLPDHKVKLAANLPYHISTPVLFRLFELRRHFSLLVLMVQREVAERMAARPSTKEYGTLSVWCQIHGKILDRVSVSPEAFFPRPKVRSMVLKIALYEQPLVAEQSLPIVRGLVRAAFGQRRKTLSNALASWLKKSREEVQRPLQDEGIEPRRRGESLAVEEFIRLARALEKTGLATEAVSRLSYAGAS